MAINTKKVLIGGVAAGVVMVVINAVGNMLLLGERMKVEANAFKAGLGDQMMAGSIVGYIIMDIVLGLALVWTYAAIRPRFGPGLKTATYVALLFWILAGIFYSGYMQMGMMSSGLWWTFSIFGLVNFLAATWVGAWLYTEGATT